ncbi:MAG: type IV pilus secretin PilQ [Thermodesulfovibrionales bacterium]|jgi:type IV pilus assembly protein PilQ|nr:type IV pilus secretin PilQ [Thermodesulfovibrionales bacterium]
MIKIGYRIKDLRFGFNVLLFAVFCLLISVHFFCGMSYAKEVKESTGPCITNIEVLDNAVKIKINGPIRYKISSPADPFRATVDIEGVCLGRFGDKIYSRQAGITEISLTQIETPIITSHLDILLQSPSIIKPEIQGDTLTLYVEPKTDAAKQELTDKRTDKGLSQQEDKPDKAGDAAKEIAAVVFDKTDVGIELVIKGDGTMPEPAVFELDGKIMIDIPDVVMKASLPSSIPSPVKDFKYKAEKGNIRFILDIEGKADTEVVAMEDEIVVDIAFKDRKIDLAKRDDIQKAPNSKLKTPNSNLVSLDFQDADIVPILRLLGDVSGYNIVIHPDVKGKISMKLMNVPWEQALDIVLKTFNLEKVIDGNVIRVATLKAFQEEKKAVAETKEVFGKAEDITTKVFAVNYSNVEKIKESIEKGKVLSPRGNISIDTRTRSLIVKDIPSSLNEIQKLIETLDKQTPQVLIESRIVEMSNNFSKSLGIEWGGHWFPPDSRTRAVGSVQSQIQGQADYLPAIGGGNYFPTITSLPATTTKIVSPTSAITLGYLNAAQTFGLDLRLSAIEAFGKAKLLSTPKIITLENEQAIIKHGKRIPITTPGTTQGTYTTTYIDANLKITVTPQIAPDGTIYMKIEVNKDEPDYTNKDILGNPAIDTRSVSTQVLVKDGETVVIGGILKSSESDTDSGVPGLSKIPLLGWLFKRETKETNSEELLIFITPRIVKR